MPNSSTQNYQLSQWSKDDQVRMEDFNADNAKIDAALKAQVDTLSAAVAMIPKVAMGTYVGTGGQGEATPTVLTLPVEAKLLIVIGANGHVSSGYFLGGAPIGMINWAGGSVSNQTVPVKWNGCTVSWYAPSSLNGLQLNLEGATYHYLVLG